ncbi:MAG: hypothetical protein ACR2PS_16545, partial [Pseudomonadales bacterium]
MVEKSQPTDSPFTHWQHYGGDKGNTHYSELNQINAGNVQHLQMEWTYHSAAGKPIHPTSELQVNPIIVDGVLFGRNPLHNVFAIKADTGKPIASFGQQGRLDLRQGLGREPEKISIYAPSPGVIYNDLIIIGTAVTEGLG